MSLTPRTPCGLFTRGRARSCYKGNNLKNLASFIPLQPVDKFCQRFGPFEDSPLAPHDAGISGHLIAAVVVEFPDCLSDFRGRIPRRLTSGLNPIPIRRKLSL